MLLAASGFVVARTGSYRPIIWGAWAVMTLGWGLMTMLDSTSNTAEKELYPLVAALGIGCLFQTPLIAVQAAMPLKDMATSTGAYIFLRTLGGTVGISIGEAIISSTLQRRLKGIPGLTINTSAAALNDSVRQISSISDPTLRAQVMHAYARSISTVWLVNTPLSAVGLFLALFIRGYSLKRTVIRGDAAKTVDPEKGELATEVGKSGVAESMENEKTEEAPIQDDATERTRTTLAGSMGKDEKVEVV